MQRENENKNIAGYAAARCNARLATLPGASCRAVSMTSAYDTPHTTKHHEMAAMLKISTGMGGNGGSDGRSTGPSGCRQPRETARQPNTNLDIGRKWQEHERIGEPAELGDGNVGLLQHHYEPQDPVDVVAPRTDRLIGPFFPVLASPLEGGVAYATDVE
eukprot:CAMPEP_0204382110 /NCGR_PEP_ID=MMETSP0469-20131031/54824_1 /ASSEMBLY_ACC=CAM_ASM_000384 /TAXON_ID=2969 /ORGANISM="Oxyrrhis marina" /LENGTH=159 /DNA_ID=CAMNT_0051374105 /DNA_START=245 /DNA_END=726 /DNA_ORIENTATION=-